MHTLKHFSPRKQTNINVVAVSNTYRDDISDGYSILDEKLTIGYSIPYLPLAFSSVNYSFAS